MATAIGHRHRPPPLHTATSPPSLPSRCLNAIRRAVFAADLLLGLHTGFILQSWTGRRTGEGSREGPVIMQQRCRMTALQAACTEERPHSCHGHAQTHAPSSLPFPCSGVGRANLPAAVRAPRQLLLGRGCRQAPPWATAAAARPFSEQAWSWRHWQCPALPPCSAGHCSPGGGAGAGRRAPVAWKLLYFLRLLRLLRVTRLGKAVWGAALSCGPGGVPGRQAVLGPECG